MTTLDLRELDAPTQVSAGSGFSVSVKVVNEGIIPPQGGNASCGDGLLSAAGESVEVDLTITNSAGQTVESASRTVCAPYGNYVPGVDTPVPTFDGLTVDGGGSYTISVEATFETNLVGSDRVTTSLSVSGSSSSGGDSDSGSSSSGGDDSGSEGDDGSVVDDVPELPELDNTQLAAAGVGVVALLYILY